MSSTTAAPSAEEQPKRKVAKKVVTPKRRYFSPLQGSVEARSLDEALSLHKKAAAAAPAQDATSEPAPEETESNG
jgi:hypothetical protein